MGRAFVDRTGITYGQLLVHRYIGKLPGKTKNYWDCLCSCGNTTQVTGSNLATGHTKSCGCATVLAAKSRRLYPKEVAAEYAVWRGIKQRTLTEKGKNVEWYQHIFMCDTWLNSFNAFFKDMGKRPSPHHSIERKNNSLGYSSSNCIWATSKEQANNRSTNLLLTLNHVTHTASVWAGITGIKAATICARVNRYKWTDYAALTTPVGASHVQQ